MNIQRTQTQADAMPLAREIARQIDIILGGLIVLLETRSHLLGRFAAPLCRRMIRLKERLLHLLADVAEGRLPRPHRPHPAPAEPKARKPTLPIPRSRLWILARLGWQAAGRASQLSTLLHAPDVATTIAMSPGATRALRPLCHLLGIDLPPPLRPNAQRATTPDATKATPDPGAHPPNQLPDAATTPQSGVGCIPPTLSVFRRA